MKQYSFRLYDEKFISAMDRWVENGYEIRQVIETLLAMYEGLELPKPNEIQQINMELREQRKEIDNLKKDSIDIVEILGFNIADIEQLKADMEIVQSQFQPTLLMTSSQAVEG